MNEYSAVLKSILSVIDEHEIDVSDAEYEKWKTNFESMTEHEKVFNLLAVLSQYLTSGCRSSATILAIAVICTGRWCDEKDVDEF